MSDYFGFDSWDEKRRIDRLLTKHELLADRALRNDGEAHDRWREQPEDPRPKRPTPVMIKAILIDGSRDDRGVCLSVDGCRFRPFLGSGGLVTFEDGQEPIARCDSLWKLKGQLFAKMEFLEEVPSARSIADRYAKGLLSGFKVEYLDLDGHDPRPNYTPPHRGTFPPDVEGRPALEAKYAESLFRKFNADLELWKERRHNRIISKWLLTGVVAVRKGPLGSRVIEVLQR